MNFNKNILVATVSAILINTSAFAVDTDVSTQDLTVIVPEVSLIDVSGSLTVTLIAPTEAGQNFSTTAVSGSPTYAISANISESAPSSTKKITATLGTIPSGWKVVLNTMAAPTGATAVSSDVALVAGTAIDTVTGIQNVAESNLSMGLSIGPADANTMPSFTAGTGKSIDIVYTITAG